MKHNDLHFQRYKDVLDVFLKTRGGSELEDIDKAKNAGFRVHDQGIVTYEQNKLGLCAYYDKLMSWPMVFIQDCYGFDHFNKTV